jgi:hypothetical protein
MFIDLMSDNIEPSFTTSIPGKTARASLGDIKFKFTNNRILNTGVIYFTIQEVDDLIYVLQKALEQYHDTVEAELQAELAKLNNDKDGPS